MAAPTPSGISGLPAVGSVQEEFVGHLKFDAPALFVGAQPPAEFMECLMGRRSGISTATPWATPLATQGQQKPVYQDSNSGGTVTYAATTVTDTAKAWATNQWVNRTVFGIGTGGALSLLVVTSNTATVLTGSGGWSNGTPSAGALYAIDLGVIGNRTGRRMSWWGNLRQDGNGNSG